MTRPTDSRTHRRLRTPAALLASTCLALAAPGLRAETELYGGIGIGYSTYEVANSFEGDPIDFEGSEFATRQFVGFNWGDYLGIEAGFVNFGTVSDTVLLPGEEETTNYRIETWGYNLSVLGRYPLNDELDAFAKVGVIRWDSEATTQNFPLPTKRDGDDVIWGVGVDFRGSRRVSVRVEGEVVSIGFTDSWWVLTTSLMYRFPFGG